MKAWADDEIDSKKYRLEEKEMSRYEMMADQLANKAAKIIRIKKEINKLNRLIKDMDKETRDTIVSLIKNAAFMTVTLEDLQDDINLNGTVEKYQNGEAQFGLKKSSSVEIYNTMIKNHMTIIKQISDLLPKAPPLEAGDNFNDFVKAK